MNKTRIFSIAAIVIATTLGGCAGNRLKGQADVVVSRIDNLKKRPNWLREGAPVRQVADRMIFLGSATIPGDHRLEAGLRVAENNARKELASAIRTRVEFIFQNAEEGTGFDASQVRYVSSEASSNAFSTVYPQNRYWEKVATMTDYGDRVTRYRIFSTVSMGQADFRRAVIDAIRAAEGRGGISKEFAEKADQQWERMEGHQAPKS